jgi:hypothetical protein
VPAGRDLSGAFASLRTPVDPAHVPALTDFDS